MRRISWIGLFLVAFLSGCSDTTTFRRLDAASAPPLLETGGKALVSLPRDGSYGATTYGGSGRMTATATRIAFAPYFDEVEAGDAPRPVEEELAAASSGGFRFLIRPDILHWEDRATGWSGRPDQLTVTVTLYDPASGEEFDSVLIEGRSKWATFGGDHPQDMLAAPLSAYAASLFRGAGSNSAE